tara:strand:+ start:99 stop:410 length:312 start_codon:yes stop_codon:yes gene_type:complete
MLKDQFKIGDLLIFEPNDFCDTDIINPDCNVLPMIPMLVVKIHKNWITVLFDGELLKTEAWIYMRKLKNSDINALEAVRQHNLDYSWMGDYIRFCNNFNFKSL